MQYDYKKLGFILLIIAVLIITASIGAFLYVFNDSTLSPDITDWGSFGSYIGGVIGGSITSLALVGAVLALFQQHNSYLKDKKQLTANSILNAIERMEDSFDAELKEKPYRVNYLNINHSLDSNAYNILTNPFAIKTEEAIPVCYDDKEKLLNNIMDKAKSDKEKLELMESYGLFSSAVGKLKFMKSLIEKHKELTGNNFVAIFYKKKYRHAVIRLKERGYPIESWDAIDEIKSS